MNNYLLAINILIPILGIIGTVILAVSANPVFNQIKEIFTIMEMVNAINLKNDTDKLNLTGFGRQLENFSFKVSSRMVYAGLGCLGASHFLQLLLYVLNSTVLMSARY